MSADIVQLITSKEFITTNVIVSLIVSVTANFLTMWLVKQQKRSVLEILGIIETTTMSPLKMLFH